MDTDALRVRACAPYYAPPADHLRALRWKLWIGELREGERSRWTARLARNETDWRRYRSDKNHAYARSRALVTS